MPRAEKNREKLDSLVGISVELTDRDAGTRWCSQQWERERETEGDPRLRPFIASPPTLLRRGRLAIPISESGRTPPGKRIAPTCRKYHARIVSASSLLFRTVLIARFSLARRS